MVNPLLEYQTAAPPPSSPGHHHQPIKTSIKEKNQGSKPYCESEREAHNIDTPMNVMDTKKISTITPCDFCGLLFRDATDMERHKLLCISEPPLKKIKVERSGSQSDEDCDEDADAENPTFVWMWDEAKEERKKNPRKAFFGILKRFIDQALDLRKNQTAINILDAAEKYLRSGFDNSKAINLALKKFKYRFEDLFEGQNHSDLESLESSEEDKDEEADDADEDQSEEDAEEEDEDRGMKTRSKK